MVAQMLVAVLVLLAGTAMAVTLTNDVPGGTRVLGIDIGGRSKAEATKVLRDGLAKRAGQPVAVTIDTAEAKINPADIGLTVDVTATVNRAATGWPNPFAGLFGGGSVLASTRWFRVCRCHAALREVDHDL